MYNNCREVWETMGEIDKDSALYLALTLASV